MKTLSRLDRLVLVVLISCGLWLAADSITKPLHPAEDAAMLMRYSEHVAQGHGIVWNIGQPPVDGATDFLFMLVLAGVYALGGGLESSVLWVGVLSHLLTTLLVYYGIRRFFNGGILVAVLSAGFLLLGSGLRYAEASFGTPFFALFCTLAWLAAQYTAEKPDSNLRCLFFAISSLLMGLARPEGVLLAGFMLLALLYKLRWKHSQKVVGFFAGIFLLLGGAYFVWRWNYFGYPLPNPFYKKGGGQLYFDSLAESVRGMLELSFPFWFAYALGLTALLWSGLTRLVLTRNWFRKIQNPFLEVFDLKNRLTVLRVVRIVGILLLVIFVAGFFRQSSILHENLVFGRYSTQYFGFLTALLVTGMFAMAAAKWVPVHTGLRSGAGETQSQEIWPLLKNLVNDTVFAAIPVIGFTLMWILLSNEMNYLWRFQYPILPIILMSWLLLGQGIWKSLKYSEAINPLLTSRSLLIVVFLTFAGGLFWSQADRWKINYQTDGRFEVAEFLSQYQARGYSMATTEAGLLPLYSGWQAVDTWGLNDPWIAHNGGITSDYLAQVNPEVIMFHADFSPVVPRREAGDAWSRMTLTLDKFAQDNGYTLAAVYGASPVDTHYYYVKPDLPESGEIIRFIQSLDGGKYQYGPHTIDYNKLTWKKDGNAP